MTAEGFCGTSLPHVVIDSCHYILNWPSRAKYQPVNTIGGPLPMVHWALWNSISTTIQTLLCDAIRTMRGSFTQRKCGRWPVAEFSCMQIINHWEIHRVRLGALWRGWSPVKKKKVWRWASGLLRSDKVARLFGCQTHSLSNQKVYIISTDHPHNSFCSFVFKNWIFYVLAQKRHCHSHQRP